MRSWECATDEAVDSLSEDFAAGQTSCKTMHDGVEANGDSFRAMARNGWDGIEGDYAEGLKFLTDVLGRQIIEVSHRAFALERFHRVAGDGLDPLESESEPLLADAEAAYERYAAGQNGYDLWVGIARTWLNHRDRQEANSDEWLRADSSFWSAVRTRNGHLTARNAAADELDAFQTTFDTLREDEERVHQEFADGLGRIPLEATRVDVEPSGSAAISVEMLMSLFDAALLTMSGNPRGASARARLARLRAAREAIAGLGDVDLDDHDGRVEDVRLLREFDPTDVDGLRDRINDALDSGDAAEAARLARMLTLGVASLSDAERTEFLNMIGFEVGRYRPGENGWVRLMMLFVADNDHPLPDWMVRAVLDLGDRLGGTFIADIQTRDMLAQLLGLDPHDPALADYAALELFRRVADTPAGHEQLLALIAGEDPGGFEGYYAAAVAYEYMLDHPELFDELLFSGRGDDLARMQEMLDLASEGATSDQMDVLFDRLVVRMVESGGIMPDSDVSGIPGQDMSDYGDDIGGLLYQFGRAGESDSYNPAGIMRFLAETAAGSVPHGSTALKFIKGAEKFFDGYQESTLYSDLGADGQRHADETLIAVGAIIAAGGPIADDLALLAEQSGDPVALYNALSDDATGDLSQYVDLFREEIVGGISEAERGDG